jgi:hypothetical protein
LEGIEVYVKVIEALASQTKELDELIAQE